jgi:acyl-CoA thioesterase FadM
MSRRKNGGGPGIDSTEAYSEGGSRASIVVQRRIEWWDTDAAGHYHFLTAFRLFEAGEIALLARLRLLDVAGRLPRLHASADFRRVLQLNELVDVTVRVDSVGNSSLTYAFEVHRAGDLCIEGRVVTALLEKAGGAKETWSDDARGLLMSAGPQTAELLKEGS